MFGRTELSLYQGVKDIRENVFLNTKIQVLVLMQK